jgi:hypothetical protein
MLLLLPPLNIRNENSKLAIREHRARTISLRVKINDRETKLMKIMTIFFLPHNQRRRRDLQEFLYPHRRKGMKKKKSSPGRVSKIRFNKKGNANPVLYQH